MSSSSVVLDELWRCGEPGMLMGCVGARAPGACGGRATTESELRTREASAGGRQRGV